MGAVSVRLKLSNIGVLGKAIIPSSSYDAGIQVSPVNVIIIVFPPVTMSASVIEAVAVPVMAAEKIRPASKRFPFVRLKLS